jgi:hypothetical protein
METTADGYLPEIPPNRYSFAPEGFEDEDEEDIDMNRVLIILIPKLSKTLGSFIMLLSIRTLYNKVIR